MEDLVLATGKAARSARHQALPRRVAGRGAEIGLARQAGIAFAAFRVVERNDVVALLQRGAGATLRNTAHRAQTILASTSE